MPQNSTETMKRNGKKAQVFSCFSEVMEKRKRKMDAE